MTENPNPHLHIDQPAKRTCILVLGMHRSGTSAVTRVVSLMGAALPKNILGAGPGNETGHWEPERLIAYHDQLLGELGSAWHDWSPLDFNKLTPERRQQIKHGIADIIQDEYLDADLIVIKDPRIGRFASFFIETLADNHIESTAIMVLRNPLDVINSLIARDYDWPQHYDRLDAALLWLAHMLESEQAARTLPHAILSYDVLLGNPVEAIKTALNNAGLAMRLSASNKTSGDKTLEIAAFIDGKHRHHAQNPQDLGLDPVTTGWVAEAYGALKDLEHQTHVEAARSILDRVYSEFQAAMPVLKASAGQRKAAFAATRLAKEEAERLRGDVEAGRAARDEVRREIETLRSELEQAEKARHMEIAEAERLRKEISQTTQTLTAEITAARQRETALLTSTSWKLTAPVRMVRNLQKKVSLHSSALIHDALLIAKVVKRTGGIRASAHKVWGIYSEKGIDGVFRRLQLVKSFNKHQPLQFVYQAQSSEISDNLRITDESAFRFEKKINFNEFPNFFEIKDFTKKSDVAIVLHIYYFDMWAEICKKLDALTIKFDLFISVSSNINKKDFQKIKNKYESSLVLNFPNFGRDVYPFIHFINSDILSEYICVCKLHTKKSPHRLDGAEWGRQLIDGMIGSDIRVQEIIYGMQCDKSIGIVGADNNIFGDEHYGINHSKIMKLCKLSSITFEQSELLFAAGTMFWMSQFMTRCIKTLNLSPDYFESEANQLDGTMAHALERFIGILARRSGLSVLSASEARRPLETAAPKLTNVKLIAFYLPQFHPIAENNKWWGEGFTEWNNVASAKKMFEAHYQPRIPERLGFYDLRLSEIQEKQQELAIQFGIDVFCYYMYFFDGKRLLELPLEKMLTNKNINQKFCICWANETWTRNWDGMASEILMPQNYEESAEAEFIRTTSRYMNDVRYFKHNGKPVFIIYRLADIPNYKSWIRRCRAGWEAAGIPNVHFCAVKFHDNKLGNSPKDLGLDAFVDFPPHGVNVNKVNEDQIGLSNDFSGLIYSYESVLSSHIQSVWANNNENIHRGIMLGWDNTARRGREAHICHGASPMRFRFWLSNLIANAHSKNPDGESLIFINAWNEWAEGTYLEPDRKNGLSYLEAVRSAKNALYEMPTCKTTHYTDEG